jgi:hypothetical protein
MRRGSGVMVADRATTLTPEAHSQDRDRMAEELRRLALEHRARGGSREDFIALATAQAAVAYDATPDVARM